MERSMIVQGNWKTFLTLRGEQLLLVQRKHVYILIAPIVMTFLLTVFFGGVSYILFIHFLFSISLFLVSLLLLTSFMLSIIAKVIIDWYFHLYIVTTRKILEVSYTPFSSLSRNDILLDRVNCTEIDVQRHGILGELMDIGDIVITFDRPTHREEFVLRDIEACNKIGIFLTQTLLDRGVFPNNVQTIWMRSPRQVSAY